MAERLPPEKNHPPIIQRPPSFQRRFIATETQDPDTLVALVTDESYFVRRQALDNSHTPQWILELLVRAGATPDLRGKGEIDHDLDPESLKLLAETGPWGRQLAAEHPNASEEVLAALKDQPSVSLRLAIAAHPHASEATLAALCCDIDEGIRAKARVNPRTPPDLIQLLETAGSTLDLLGVTSTFGELLATDFALLARLGPWGRFLVARHPDCPVDLLLKIANDPEWRVRSGLLDNPNAPAALIEQMLDEPSSVCEESIQALSQPHISREALVKLVVHPNPEVRYALARHPAATPEILGWLASDGVKEIRRLTASHSETDTAVIQRLVQAGSKPDLMGLREPDPGMPAVEIQHLLDGGVWARLLAVRHPNTDAITLARLLCDREPKIREWATVHPNLDPEIKRDLIRAGSGTDFQGIMPPDPTLESETLYQISQLGSWGEWVVANNPYAPAALLDSLAGSDDWQVRLFVARNPNTASKTITNLASDSVAEVRQAAGRPKIR